MAFAAFGIVYFLLALYAVRLPLQSQLPLFIWPAHGLALGTLLVAPMRRWPVYLALVLVASGAIGVQLPEPWTRIAIMLAVNVILPFFIAAGLLRLAGPEVKIENVRCTAQHHEHRLARGAFFDHWFAATEKFEARLVDHVIELVFGKTVKESFSAQNRKRLCVVFLKG